MHEVDKEIIDWIQAKPYWVQLAAKRLYAQEEVEDELIEELLGHLKTKEGQANESKIDLAGISKGSSATAGDTRILSIGKIEGVDALAPRSPLPFSSNLSVVYGQNGSGKSGYARILKKLCGKPNAEDLLPNVFKSSPQKRECTVVAGIDGAEKTFVWQVNSRPVEELLLVDVFDNQTGSFYIDKEQEVSYVPNEVALFERLVVVFQKMQSKLKSEKEAINSKLPDRPTEFGNNKYIAAIYEHLKHDSDIKVVEDFFSFTDEDKKNLAKLEERISASPSDLAHKKQKRITQMELLIEQATTAANLVSSESVKTLEKLEVELQQKRKIASKAAKAIVKETSFDGFGNEAWKAMWQAARNYSEKNAYPGVEYPVTAQDAKCVLCEQELGESAKTRLLKFESYVTGELESTASTAEITLQSALNKLPTKPQETELVTAIQAAQLEEDMWLPVLVDVWSKIENVVLNEKDKERHSHIHYDLPKGIFGDVEALISELRLEVQQHKKDSEKFDKEALKKRISELKAKKWSSGYIQSIKDEISQLQKKHKVEEWLKSVNTAAVSREAGRISEALVTDAFVSRFNKELKLLGAQKVRVELIKTKTKLGRVHHKIQLHGLNSVHSSSKAINVLSEGEQRVVSLAAFLADVTSKPNSAPFIFDDPISSLDQTYEEHTARRLISLSDDRQVIVFTHRLSLLGQLVDKGKAEYRYIRREPWGCGEHGDLPLFAKKPIKAVKDLKNTRLSAAKKAYEEHGSDSYYPLAKAICSDFRILLERIVEFELLADVVTRHRREVHTKGKIHKLAKITSEDCELFEQLMGDFSCFEHSQSDEAPVEIPEPDVLNEALTKIIDWHSSFNS